MSEYIERGAAIQALVTDYAYAAADLVSKLPAAADVVEVKHGNCSWCKPGDERCGTCVKFFDYHGDGGYDKCSASCVDIRCVAYEPMHACPNCGAKMDA